MTASRLHCQGCGLLLDDARGAPYRCPRAGDGGDHVVAYEVPSLPFPSGSEENPFLRYRALSYAHAVATSRGMVDAAFAAVVGERDHAVAEVAGRGFVATPFGRAHALSDALGFGPSGGVWVKDETGNVSGSHKGRHLMGLAILSEVQARLGIAPAPARLSIASCGNAALAAAVVARAWGKPIDVFIPPDANPSVVAELERLGAIIHVCGRTAGVAGDPCHHAFRAAVEAGAMPFCCQGSDNGLTIEGGKTLAWEMVSELVRTRVSLDRLFVQVGGGALASACVQGLSDARRLGVALPLPRLHAVQTRGAFPLRRAWERVVARVGDPPDVEGAVAYAAAHRAAFMWPWETEPRSVAHGILDDETYDWRAIVRGTIESGGEPLVVDEARLIEASELGRRATGIDVDATGSAGLAGLMELRAAGGVGEGERVGVLFTGVKRG